MRHLFHLALMFALIATSCTDNAPKEGTKEEKKAEELNVYTHRHYEADKELFTQFEELTGIKVNVVNAKADELMMKIEQEGELSPADVLITVDAGRLVRAKDKGILQSVKSELLNAQIPVKYRDGDGHWFGLTKRARVLLYNPEVMKAEDFSSYADLADPKWKGAIAVRSSSNIYNQSLMASVIANTSVEDAKLWAEGVVSNMCREPKGNDRDQIKAAYFGDAKVAIANTYYLGKMINSSDEEEAKIGKAMSIFFPNQETTGTHVNISGAGVCKHAPNKDNAIKFLEFLSAKEAQEKFSTANYEYPVNTKADISELLLQWGKMKEDPLNLSILGELNKQAVQTFDAAGWK